MTVPNKCLIYLQQEIIVCIPAVAQLLLLLYLKSLPSLHGTDFIVFCFTLGVLNLPGGGPAFLDGDVLAFLLKLKIIN